MKYRIEFENKEIRSIHPTEQELPAKETFHEEKTGQTIWAIIEASSDDEAREKADRLAIELQTGQTKDQIKGRENSF
ncbi:hypothetical protein [Polluticoccus soli]|uniref:hypothetical protein n=1 Tax=Polluticoccus soli TaxID=3034150 RepID=UPI0023E2B1D4|nr:hypothetical protein [Flavipsychrobacter sp. JY13-12]